MSRGMRGGFLVQPVDSKLSCPVVVAHDLSGVPLPTSFSAPPTIACAPLLSDSRSTICSTVESNLRGQVLCRAAAHPRDSARDTAAHGTPPAPAHAAVAHTTPQSASVAAPVAHTPVSWWLSLRTHRKSDRFGQMMCYLQDFWCNLDSLGCGGYN